MEYSKNYDILLDQCQKLEKSVEFYKESAVTDRKIVKELSRKVTLYESNISQGLNLTKVKNNNLLPVETKMISTLRDWADSIENGETGVYQDYSIACNDALRTLSVDFKLLIK